MTETIAALSALIAMLSLLASIFVSTWWLLLLFAACTVFMVAESRLALPYPSQDMEDKHKQAR